MTLLHSLAAAASPNPRQRPQENGRRPPPAFQTLASRLSSGISIKESWMNTTRRGHGVYYRRSGKEIEMMADIKDPQECFLLYKDGKLTGVPAED